MTRLTPLTYEKADDDQRELWDAIVESRGGQGLKLTGEHGELAGPFNAFVTSPSAGSKLGALGSVLRFESQVERRLLELAICTTGAHWESNFEFYAHGPLAIDAGIAPDILDAIQRGETPDFAKADEAIIYKITTEMLNDGRVGSETYAAAVEVLGEPALVDLVVTIGYYCLVSLTLNTFEVPLPEGVTPFWD